MKIATSTSIHSQAELAVRESYAEVHELLGGPPDLLVALASADFDIPTLASTLGELAPEAAIHGSTSSHGVMTQEGSQVARGRGLGLFAARDPHGSYGVGIAEIQSRPREAARRAVEDALRQAERIGEAPELVWISSPPGPEEEILVGVADLLGPSVPVLGGTSGDNSFSGDWRQFTGGGAFSDAVVATVLFPSRGLAFAITSGYEPTGLEGVVTRAEARTLYEIDGRPAAEVYNEWTGGRITGQMPQGGSVLEATTLYPLGRVVDTVEGFPLYILSQPWMVTEERALTLLTATETGSPIHLMTGTRQSLTQRAGRTVRAALEAGELAPFDVAGGLITYCAACMFSMREEMDEVVRDLTSSLPRRPFLGYFSFGEQACWDRQANYHGNLMISALLFRG